MIKVELSTTDLALINNSLELQYMSIKRQLAKQVSGSSLFTAYSDSLSEISTLQRRLYSLKGN
jgi:hypothetical protein